MDHYGVSLDYHSFARPQNNCDEHILEWFINNSSESDIDSLVRHDYLAEETGMHPIGITKEEIDEYYPENNQKNDGLLDLSKESDDSMANVIVYNGCTGSFLDNNFKKGNFFRRFFHGIRKDKSSIESILQLIQTNNRFNDSNTQVYLCGVPNLMGVYASNAMNSRLKRLAKKYANVTYVPSIATEYFYHPLNSDDPDEVKADLHYSEEEYLRFISNIVGSIGDNYAINRAMIDLDRELYKLSQQMEKMDFDSDEHRDFVNLSLDNMLEKATRNMSTEEKRTFLDRARRYVSLRFPYDFYYLGKNNISKAINSEEVKKQKVM